MSEMIFGSKCYLLYMKKENKIKIAKIENVKMDVLYNYVKYN